MRRVVSIAISSMSLIGPCEFLSTGLSEETVMAQTVDQLKAKLSVCATKASSIVIDGSLSDWDGLPVFSSQTNDGCIESHDINDIRIAPLPEKLLGAVTIAKAPSEDTDLVLDIDLWGQMQIDFRVTIPLKDPSRSLVSLNTGESWYSVESDTTNGFVSSAIETSISEDGAVEFSIHHDELRKLINKHFELRRVFNRRKGTFSNQPNSRSWVRVSPSLKKQGGGIIDRGIACGCWIMSESTQLPSPEPMKGMTYLDIPFDDQWYVGQAGFGIGTHSQIYAYDFYQTDKWLHPSRNWRSSNNEDYFSWHSPIYAPASGRVTFQKSDSIDIPSIYPNENPSEPGNRVVVQAEENEALISLLHLAKDSVAVELGDTVSASTQIAKCGNSGQTGWPHLHVECRVPPNSKSYTDAVPLGFRHVSISLNRMENDPWRIDLPYWEIQEGFFVCIARAIINDASNSRRVWNDRSGRFSVDAKILEYNDETVKFEKSSNEFVVVPISKLAFDDQSIIRYLLRMRPE